MALMDEMQELMRELASDPDFKQGSTQLLKFTPGTGPAHNPGPSTVTAHEIDGFVRGVLFKYVASNLAAASDMQITYSIKPDVPNPDVKDSVMIDGVIYKIVQVISLPGAGTLAAWRLIIRRG